MPAASDRRQPAHADLVLVRHGESAGNAAGVFTGWRDVDLTERGRQQAVAAGQRLRDEGVEFALALTSVLRRAIATAEFVLAELEPRPPCQRDWRLNERHCGAMQGLDKAAAKRAFGAELARTYRRSWDTAPPPVAAGSTDDPRSDPRYRELGDRAPRSESMGMLAARVLPVWTEVIEPALRRGDGVLVVGHGMALRALARPVERLTAPGLPPWKLASAAPRWYRLDAALAPIEVVDLGRGEDAPEE